MTFRDLSSDVIDVKLAEDNVNLSYTLSFTQTSLTHHVTVCDLCRWSTTWANVEWYVMLEHENAFCSTRGDSLGISVLRFVCVHSTSQSCIHLEKRQCSVWLASCTSVVINHNIVLSGTNWQALAVFSVILPLYSLLWEYFVHVSDTEILFCNIVAMQDWTRWHCMHVEFGYVTL